MDSKEIQKVWQAFLEVQEGKKGKKEGLDPVDKDELKGKHKDREDKDIDNDGDVDSSDEYLHNRRKAVSKAISKDKGGDEKEESYGKMKKEGKIPPQFMKGKDKEDDSDDKEENGKDDKKKPKKGVNPFSSKDDKEDVKESSCGKTRKEEKEECPKCKGEGCDHCDGKGYHEAEKEGYGKKMKESNLFSDRELADLEEKMGQPGDTGTPPEGMFDKSSPKSKKFVDDHKKGSDKKFEDMEAQGEMDAVKAGRGVKSQSPARRGDNLSNGDKMQAVSKVK